MAELCTEGIPSLCKITDEGKERVFSLISFGGQVVDLANYQYVNVDDIVAVISDRMRTKQKTLSRTENAELRSIESNQRI
jgi:hypothetical protein